MRVALFLPALALGTDLFGQADGSSAAKTRTLEVRDGETLALGLRISTPTEQVSTAVTFPDLVRDVVASWNDKDLSVEYQGSKLFLKLFAKAEGHLDVVTAAGTHVRLYVRPRGAGEEYDGHVILKLAPGKNEQESSRKSPEVLELVRGMRLGVVPAGATVKRGPETVLFASGDLEGKLAYLYETATYRGYVLRLANKSRSQAYEIDASRFSSSHLVLVGAKSLLVGPERSTLVYLVLSK